MSDPTNEPSREPISEPTNDQTKTLTFNDKSSSKFQLVVASVANECSKGLSKKTAQCTIKNSLQSRSFIDDVSIDSWQCPMKIDEVNFQPVGNNASTQLVGSCHDNNSERVGNGVSTQLVGSCHDNKSERVTFNKQEKDAVLLYYLWSKDTQHHYKEEPLQKHCCTDSGIQSKLIFTSEKTNHRQPLTHAANSERDALASLLLPVHKSVGIQPLSLHLTNKSRRCQSFVDNVLIDSWQCQMETDKVKSKKMESEPIASHSTIQSEPIASHSTNQNKQDKTSATFKLVVASIFNNISIDS